MFLFKVEKVVIMESRFVIIYFRPISKGKEQNGQKDIYDVLNVCIYEVLVLQVYVEGFMDNVIGGIYSIGILYFLKQKIL